MAELTHIIGNVGQDPQDKTIKPSGPNKTTEITEFSMGVPLAYGPGGATKWYQVSVWDEKLRDIVKDGVHKGAALAITGNSYVREYQGKTYYSMIAGRIYRLDRLGGGEAVPMRDHRTPATKAAPAEAVEDF